MMKNKLIGDIMKKKLEFELEMDKKIKNQLIKYKVLRKGLLVGLLVLSNPYDKKEIEKKFMTMYD